MQYAVALANGSVSIVDVAPKSVVIGEREYRINMFERSANGGYVVPYFDEDEQRPVTRTFSSKDPALRFHQVESELAKMKAEYTEIIPITDPSVLKDRTFRNAWTINESELATDMVRAREIHREHLRVARAPLFEQADVEYYKALEASVATGLSPETSEYAAMEAAAAKKQKLRDIPQMPEIEAAQTPEQLKQVWPTELGPNTWLTTP